MILLFKVAIILLVGYIGGVLANRLKLPNVSGYLIFGLILGPSLGLIFSGYGGFITAEDQGTLKFISELALSFIAFSIGSEFNLNSLKKNGKEINIITIFEVVVVVILVFLLLFFIPKPAPIMDGYQPFSKNNIAIGLVLASMSAATAPAATLMVIRQYRAYGPLTKKILPITALDDIYGIIVFGFSISFAGILVQASGNMPLWLSILKPFIEVFGSIIAGVIFGYVLSQVINLFKIKVRDDLQVLSLIVVVLTTSLTAIINKQFSDINLGLSSLLMNMAVGAMVTNIVKKPADTFNSVNDFTTPIYIMFFTLAGASLDLAVLKNSYLIIVLALVFIVGRAAGKHLGAFTGAHITKEPKSVRNNLGIALLPQGGISLGLLIIVQAQLPEFFPLISTIIMLSILFFETSGPIFAKYAISKAGEIGGLDRLDQISSMEGIEEGVY
ncbi:MAG TPA: cation:proton antiporter [Acholeplasma sp.]|jgi:Kef-type K+ transport system membrane component KefB|nr:cation:proton antiporter [Acholeplasma sp.]